MKQLMTILMVMVLMASPVWAQDCIDYGDYIHGVGTVDTPGDARGVAISGNHAYVADGYAGGLTIAPTQCDDIVSIEDNPEDPNPNTEIPVTSLHLSTCPNPFNPHTTISFSLPTAGHVHLQIIDLRGRSVVTLVSEALAAGHHTTQWDGRDSRGGEVPSGVYLSRLEAGGHLIHGRMTLVR